MLIGSPNANIAGSVGGPVRATFGLWSQPHQHCNAARGGMFGQERENKTRDVVVLLVQGKMAGVEQVDFGIRQSALERLRTGSDE
jgi:hypothetical protein